jgi:hypothetical protein
MQLPYRQAGTGQMVLCACAIRFGNSNMGNDSLTVKQRDSYKGIPSKKNHSNGSANDGIKILLVCFKCV